MCSVSYLATSWKFWTNKFYYMTDVSVVSQVGYIAMIDKLTFSYHSVSEGSQQSHVGLSWSPYLVNGLDLLEEIDNHAALCYQVGQ